jgi:hypothetical protein
MLTPDSVDTDSENEELVLEATNSLLPEQDLWVFVSILSPLSSVLMTFEW